MKASAASSLTLLALLALSGAALLLRTARLDFELPHYGEPDSEVVTQVELLRGERVGPRHERDLGTYPLLTARVAKLLFAEPPPAAPDAPLAEHLEAVAATHVQARRTVALLSLLIVPAAFLLARLFLTRGWALVAAAWTAFSLLSLEFSQQARPHAVAAALVAWAALAAVHLRRRGDGRAYLLAGLAGAAALASLHSAVAVLPALLAGHLLRDAPRRRWLDPRALLALAPIAAAVPLFYPGAFSRPEAPSNVVPVEPGPGQLVFGNHLVELGWFDGSGFLRVLRTLWWYEPALLVVLVTALPLALVLGRLERAKVEAGERRDALVLGAYVLPYLLVIGVFGQTFERFVLPLLPFFALLAAWALARLWRHAPGRAARTLEVTAIAVALLFSLNACARLSWVRAQPTTSQQAAAWLVAHAAPAPGGDPIFVDPVPNESVRGLDLPLWRSTEFLVGKDRLRPTRYAPWTRYQVRLTAERDPRVDTLYDLAWQRVLLRDLSRDARPDPAWMAEHPEAFFVTSGPGLFVIEDFAQRDYPEHNGLRLALQQLGELQARFSPYHEGIDWPFPLGYQDRTEDGGDWPSFVRRVLAARAVGPVIEIYRVRAGSLER